MSKALVPVELTVQARPLSCTDIRSRANFVAQLIATAAQAPQTRARRRAEPEAAVAAYSVVGHWPTESRHALLRSL
jgi:hypothetical protein